VITLRRAAWCLVPLGLAFAVQNRFTLSILAFASTQALYVASWDLVGVTSGQPTLGHALPWGTGAYVAAFVAGWGMAPLPIALAGGTLAGGLAGGLQGTVGARLSRLSLALVTLATAESAREISGMFRFLWPGGLVVGGDGGIPMAVYPADEASAARLAAVVLAVGIAGLLCVERSNLGLAMRIVRADDRLAAASGIDAARVRVLAFVIAGATAGIAGGLAAGIAGGASPVMLSLEPSLFSFAVASIAGPGTIVGPAAAAYAMAAGLQALGVPGTIRLALSALLLIGGGLGPKATASLRALRRPRTPLAEMRAP
jgi:branched-chain amino acid transport system permease protein